MNDSRLIRKEPCPECGSRDNLARYSDGHAHCFSHGCDYWEKGDSDYTPPKRGTVKEFNQVATEIHPLIKRGITLETCQHFGYGLGTYNGKPVQVAPYYHDGKLVAQHLRTKDKQFPWTGSTEKLELFGQRLWRDGGKKVVITEGEIDAMSVSQIQDNKWPVVSLPNGTKAGLKYLQQNLEWLEKFEEVILMFDMDEPGRDAVEECAPLFTPGKCKVASLPLKDANEMLQARRAKEVIDAIWGAKVHRPDGVVSVHDILDEVLTPIKQGLPWCFPGMTKATYGRRSGEIYGFGAGTGIGKTDFFTQQIDFDVRVLEVRCGILYLEQPTRETVRRVAGKSVGKMFHLPEGEGYTTEELGAAVNALDATGRLHLFSHFGVTDFDVIKSRIRYMVAGLGCKHIYLDHLTALVSGEEDERKALDRIMAELAGQAQELGHILHYISHLATPEGKPHEEGGRVMVRHFRGARSIGFWSHFMFGLERNCQADDPIERSQTTLRCLKDRNTGRATGTTWTLNYDRETGLLSEGEPAPAASPFTAQGPDRF